MRAFLGEKALKDAHPVHWRLASDLPIQRSGFSVFAENVPNPPGLP